MGNERREESCRICNLESLQAAPKTRGLAIPIFLLQPRVPWIAVGSRLSDAPPEHLQSSNFLWSEYTRDGVCLEVLQLYTLGSGSSSEHLATQSSAVKFCTRQTIPFLHTVAIPLRAGPGYPYYSFCAWLCRLARVVEMVRSLALLSMFLSITLDRVGPLETWQELFKVCSI